MNSDQPESTYGEVIYEHFATLLEHIKPQPRQVFWDLGCGSAKPLAIAALQYPDLLCYGVENMPNLAELGKKAIEEIKSQVPKMAKSEIKVDDLFAVDWQTSADIIYVSNVCFPSEMNDKLALEMKKVKKGTIIIALLTFKEELIEDILKIQKNYSLNMTWGAHQATIYKRL